MTMLQSDQLHCYSRGDPQQSPPHALRPFPDTSFTPETFLGPFPKRQKTSDALKGSKKWVPGGSGGGGRRVNLQSSKVCLQTPKARGGPTIDERRSRARSNRTSRPPARSSARRTTSRPHPRYSTSTAAAAAADGYKPREERGWEEFHPDLNLEWDLPVIPSDLVDGQVPTSGSADGILYAESNSTIAGHKPAEFQPPTLIKKKLGRPFGRSESMLNELQTSNTQRVVPPPGPNPKEKLTLPRPSFKEHDPFLHFEQKDVAQVNFVDRSMASVGYQESEVFVRPDQMLIRLTEDAADEEFDLLLASSAKVSGENAAIGSSGVGRVEYDMDEQDAKWLEMLNKARKQEQVEAIKPAIFEITMTKIEKEWHALEKQIPRNDPKPPQTQRPRSSSAAAVNGEPGHGEEQDSKCAICDDGDCENANAIVFCDGCDLAVHQECYGVPYIPEGQWLCRKCQLIGRGTPACIFCPNTEGAFKQTNNAKWSHLLCASWIPEVSIGNMSLMEPILDVEKVPSSRWRLTCFICLQKMGACIQCSHRNCYQAFHVTCARRARMYLRMKSGPGANSLMEKSHLKALCDKHLPPEWRLEHDTERAVTEAKKHYAQTMKNRKWTDSQVSALSAAPPGEEASSDSPSTQRVILYHGNNRRNKAATKAIWRLPSGAPVIPEAICRSIEASLQRFNVRKKKDFVAEICKYWTLKREARRGAPLLKRLQLQMDSFSSGDVTRRDYAAQGASGLARLNRRIAFGEYLLHDLEYIRQLTALIKEREALKLTDAVVLRDLVDTVYFPIIPMLRPIVQKAVQLDSKQCFKHGLQAIRSRVEHRAYVSVAIFSADLANVLSSELGVQAANTAELQEQVSGRAVDMTAEQRERRKLAKRIVKSVQPALEEALRHESELNGRPFENQIRELDSMLDTKVLSRQESFTGSGIGDVTEMICPIPDAPDHQATLPIRGRSEEPRLSHDDSVNGRALLNGEEIPVVETNESELRTVMKEHPSPSFEPCIVGVGATTPPPSINDAKNERPDDSTAAPNNSTMVPAKPPTPPLSLEGIQHSTATIGIPWYVEPFDIDGTTLHEERWTGPQVLREMSEELSEIDDEELEDLGAMAADDDVEMTDALSTNPTIGPAATQPAASGREARNPNVKKNGKLKRRWRGFR